MQCKNCGTINTENSKFCKRCGEKIVDATPNADKKKVNKILRRTIFLIFIVLLVCCILGFLKENEKKVCSVENTIIGYIGTEDNSSYIVDTNKKIVINGISDIRGWKKTACSMDGATSVYLLNDNSLIMVQDASVIEVAEGVQSFAFADNGNKIAYCDMDNALLLYDCESMLVEKIANRVSEDNFKLSPQGKAVTYVDQEAESKLCVYFNETVYEIGEDLLPIALPDNAKYIYCYNTQNDGIYVKYLNGESKKLATNNGWIFILNKEHTQLQFLSNDSWFVSDEGEDKIKLFDNCNSGISLSATLTGNVINEMCYGQMGTYVRGISDLTDAFYVSTDSNNTINLYYVDKEWNGVLIEEDIARTGIDKTGKDIFYIKDNRLFKIEDGKYKNPFFVTDNVKDFVVTSDGEEIYYIDNEDTLWYKKGRNDAKRIADEVSNNYFCITYDDYVLFLTDYSNGVGILYSSYRGKEKERIADDVIKVTVSKKFVEYRTNYDYETETSDLYGANNKTDFTLILEKVY